MPAKSAVKRDLGAFLPLVSSYRILLRPGVEIIHARLHSGVDPTDPRVHALLTSGGRTVHLSAEGDGVDVLMVRTEEAPNRVWLHLALFVLTAVSVLVAGALFAGVDPLRTRIVEVVGWSLPMPTGFDLRRLAMGWSFAGPFLLILGVHEGGHMWAARRHGVAASLPWFVPMPPYLSIIGTLGAFIRLRGPMVRRSALLDIGAWGPIAGFLVAVPVFAWGVAHSQAGFAAYSDLTPFVARFAGEPISLGASPLTAWIAAWVGPDARLGPVALHPTALAGWLGLFFTALNLVPMGQLDGGHVLYSVGAGVQRTAGRFAVAVLALLGVLWWGWWFWAGVVLLIGGGRIAHPPLFQERVPLSPGRRWVAWITILIFFLTFVPIPISL